MPMQSWSPKAALWSRPIVGEISLRLLLPNLITLIALCFGMTAVKLAFEGRYELGVVALLVAVALDGVDGRLARLMDGTSKFGAEFDSLADAINFGVAPALILYSWTLHALGAFGWAAALTFGLAIALRLARFNVSADVYGWKADFFCGMPAPAAAATALFPLYLSFAGAPRPGAAMVALYLVAVAGFAISTVPFYSGKHSGLPRVPNRAVLVPAALAVLAVGGLVFPWATLSLLAAVYLATIPLGLIYYRRLQAAGRRAATAPIHGL